MRVSLWTSFSRGAEGTGIGAETGAKSFLSTSLMEPPNPRSGPMRFPWISRVFLALLLTLLVLVPPASAFHQGSTQVVTFQVGENVDLPINNWTGYTFTLASGDQIQYGIQ